MLNSVLVLIISIVIGFSGMALGYILGNARGKQKGRELQVVDDFSLLRKAANLN